ncbi:MAG: sugar ABC transporter permease, partial [Gammaproteobacteria bacterium]|nr:sugar ABC transporter permease [Gammaproteobacteria bacterium]
MATTADTFSDTARSTRERIQQLLPKLVLSPSFALILLFVYGFIAFTAYLSFTDSRLMPTYDLIGIGNYVKLFKLRHWSTALNNLAIFGVLYIGICTVLGLG